jgi:hypothetical protein
VGVSQVLQVVGEITPDWLTDRLRRSGALPSGAVRSVTVTRVHTDQLHSLGYFLHIVYTADVPVTAPMHLFLKLPRPGADPAVTMKVGMREVGMYRALARDQTSLPVIPCYDAAYDAEQPAYHLLLADLSATHDQPADYRTIADRYIERTVDSLALFHAYWWEHARLGCDVGDLPDAPSITAGCKRLRAALPAFADLLGERMSPEDRRIYERVLVALPTLRARRAAPRGQTIVHGDAHFWNFLYPRDLHGGHTCIIDWHTYYVGRGADDLAYAIVLRYPHRTLANERRLVRRYHDGLLAHGVTDYAEAACWDDYRRAAAEHVVASLGWWCSGLPESFWGAFVQPPLRAFRDLMCAAILPS